MTDWCVGAFLLALAASGDGAPRRKFVELGWDIVDTAYLRAHHAEMERNAPFDGAMIRVAGKTADGKPAHSEWCWDAVPWDRASFQPAVDDLHRLGMVRRSTGKDGPQFTLNTSNPWTRRARAMLNLVYLDPLLDDLSRISHKVILFGEAAHGGESLGQAIDLLIVTTARDRHKVLRALAASELNGRLRPTVVDGDELAALPHRNRALYDQVSRGLVLWER